MLLLRQAKPHIFLEQYWVTPLSQLKLTQEYERTSTRWKPEPPLEKNIQFHSTDTTHCYNKVHKIHSYCDDEESQKAELLRYMTDHGITSTAILSSYKAHVT
ncbi:conserved hypothetical protein [Trichinella spiralis]|uniref:hypothetical protein n=1 Tax=Trichinella spiralis TaxID=6334 RepID=UPI0001EFBBAA|nr:conserved hypothetical protein [Trichinella spiralis]